MPLPRTPLRRLFSTATPGLRVSASAVGVLADATETYARGLARDAAARARDIVTAEDVIAARRRRA